MKRAENKELRILARKILEIAGRNSQKEGYPPPEKFWHDLNEVLRQLRFSSEESAFARGKFVAAYVGITKDSSEATHDEKSTFGACLTLFPYENRWSLVRGVEIILVGKEETRVRMFSQTARTSWEGGATFPGLPAGEYQILLANDVQEATWQAAQELLRGIGPMGEEKLEVSNPLVTITVEKKQNLGSVELAVSIQPHANTVDVNGLPVIINSPDVGQPYIGIVGSDGRVIFPKIERPFISYAFTDHPGAVAAGYSLGCRVVESGTLINRTRISAATTGKLVAQIRGTIAASTQRTSPGTWSFPEEEKQQTSPLVCTLYLKGRGYSLRAHFKEKPEREPRLAYALVERVSGKVAIVSRGDKRILISGNLPLKKIRDGSWFGETQFPILGEEEMSSLTGDYRLVAYVIYPEEERSKDGE